MQAMQAHAEALAMSMDHNRILAHSRQAVARRLLSSLPSAPRNNARTESQDRAKTLEPSVLPRRPALVVLAQLKSRETARIELHELGDCIAHPETACNCVKVNIMGRSPAAAWTMLGKRFQARHFSSASAPPSFARHRRADFDSSNHPAASPLSRATTEGASSPQEASPPLFARSSSDPPRLLTPLVSIHAASKERHAHRRASDTSAKDDTAFALRRLRSDPSHTTKPRDSDESPAPTRAKNALRSSAPLARPARSTSTEPPIAPSAFVAQLRHKCEFSYKRGSPVHDSGHKCEKLLPAPERNLSLQGYLAHKKTDHIALGVPRGAKRSGVPSVPKSN